MAMSLSRTQMHSDFVMKRLDSTTLIKREQTVHLRVLEAALKIQRNFQRKKKLKTKAMGRIPLGFVGTRFTGSQQGEKQSSVGQLGYR